MANYKKEDRTIPELDIAHFGEAEFQTPSSALETDNYNCFGITPRDVRPSSLKVFFNNGGVVLVQYGRMVSPITFDGKDKIAIETPTLRLEITGSNLVPLIDYIGEQRLAWIKSIEIGSETDLFMVGKGEPEIRSIRIHSKNSAG